MLLNCQCRTAMVRRVMTTWWLTFPMRYVCGSFDFLLLLVLTMTTVPTISVHNVFLISKGTHNLFYLKNLCITHHFLLLLLSMKCTYVLLPTGMHTRHLLSVYRSPQVTCKFTEFLFLLLF